ncbi:response regulator transcription factor [Amycolatopsis acidiphila]|uniref:Response regulator transcription factor n=1 Tax=Amycolatopsis acidiphila TaxID=715473 RepID=A0A558AJ85_9PSEU|nr:response regulator transcription factor [Amycolatopsis acidiphila]TVT24323.1 response regulator transcription factor [Amycolatopsis acidiphila]UIJ62543.1 response regulator transcription factor [Amycolatopsis acidiphila]GHG85310.1 DNA-binding response regulator [Amycolatopsis acidiphila]
MRILVIEDEQAFAETLRKGLTADGFTVEVAHTGPDGLWLATEHVYDVIVLDIMLPGMSGYTVLKRLRERHNWTPVLILTAKDGEYDEADAFDLGADDYLTKPFSYIVLLARLRALLRRGAPERPAVLTLGDLRLDPAARTVHKGHQEVELTAREFGLLEFLLRRRGEALSKHEILTHVWDAHYDGDENVVEVYIGYLRRKIGPGYIQTLRGVGYRLS